MLRGRSNPVPVRLKFSESRPPAAPALYGSMSYEPLRSTMSRVAKMRASHASERDGGSATQMNNRPSQQQPVLTGSVAILWDMENCPVPSDVKADDVAGNIRMALRSHPLIQGAVTFFSAYGDFNHFLRKVREGCQRTGVNLIDVPNGKKDASDKAILVDLFLFALDNAPPCTIFLISGDVDFAPALHKLGQRGYTVVLAIPSGVGVSSALCSAGTYVWDWPSVARGGGLVPAKNVSARSSVDERTAEIIEMNVPGGHLGPVWSHDEDSDLASDDQGPYGEEQIVWRSPAPLRSVDHGLSDGSFGPKPDTSQQRNSGTSFSHSSGSGKLPPFAPYPPAPREQSNTTQPSGGRGTVPGGRESVRVQNDAIGSSGARECQSGRVQSSDATGSNVARGGSKNVAVTPMEITQAERSVRDQLVRLVSLNGQKMELSRVQVEFQKQFGKPLIWDSGNGNAKLLNLLERFGLWLFMRGEGATRTVHLTKTGSRVAAKLKREAKSARGAPKGEVEVILNNFIDPDTKTQVKDGGEDDYETAGEEVLVGCSTKGIQSRIVGVKDRQQRTEGQNDNSSKELDEIHLPRYDWGFGSGGSGGLGDEKDNALQEAKDVEIDEATLEQVVKPSKGNVSGGWDILDDFRWELQDLLVSFACKVPMGSFMELYQQRYSKPLEYAKFGVIDLESLVEKVSDVATITEMDVKDLESVIEKVSDVAEVFMEDKKTKLKVLVAHRSDLGEISEKTTRTVGGGQE